MMPSRDRLMEWLGIHAFQADKIRELIASIKEPKDADTVLSYANDVLSGYGVEPLRADGAQVDKYYYDIVALYVNRGDTYDTTLLYDTEAEKFSVISYGDWIEIQEGKKRYQFS